MFVSNAKEDMRCITMRNKNRIDPFLKEIRRIWKIYPELRFGQLLANTAPLSVYPNLLYTIEEDVLLDALIDIYGRPVKNVLIMGAAGRDFHNFNVYFKDNPEYKVCCFTATQIPGIDNKTYPSELAGKMYPGGIPIHSEDDMDDLIADYNIDEVYFCYSDVSYEHIDGIRDHLALFGIELKTLGPEETQLVSTKPVISVTAVRTGCGKSSVSKKIATLLTEKGFRVGIIRHPMPYADDLNTQRSQKFSRMEDLKYSTIEEREEYEPYISNGMVIWAGIDYEEILHWCEEESDIILWDGGNNDFSFIKPNLSIVVADPLRVGNESLYYPSDININDADVVIINKCNTASGSEIEQLMKNIMKLNYKCEIIRTDSVVTVDNPEIIKNKQVLVVEDGPTLTHGGMKFGAGIISTREYNSYISIPIKYAVGSIADTYKKYPHLYDLIPAMGYSPEQLQDLEDTINAVPCEAVVIATPIDLGKLININKPYTRVHYDIEDGRLDDVIYKFLQEDYR